MANSGGALVAWGRVLRLSLLPTALADGLAGFALAGLDGLPSGSQLGLFGASAGIYHGAMALNDWSDSHEDADARPDRPIPAGLLQRRTVLAVAIGMIAGGVLLASSIHPRLGLWMGAIAALAIGYDLWMRGPFLGPLSLGTCRAMHLAAPIVLLSFHSLEAYWPICIAYGLFVFTLSSLARLETLPTALLGRKPVVLLCVQAAAFCAPLLLAISSGSSRNPWALLILTCFGCYVLLTHALHKGEWTPERVQAAVGAALRLLLVFTAAAALAGAGSFSTTAAVCILAGYPIAHALRKVFPPT